MAKIPKFPVRIAPLEDLEDGRAGGLDLDGRHVRAGPISGETAEAGPARGSNSPRPVERFPPPMPAGRDATRRAARCLVALSAIGRKHPKRLVVRLTAERSGYTIPSPSEQ